jgi:hypothetical protein
MCSSKEENKINALIKRYCMRILITKNINKKVFVILFQVTNWCEEVHERSVLFFMWVHDFVC